VLWPGRFSSIGWVIRDWNFQQQRYRASGPNLVTAAVVLWNTVYLERATTALRETGKLKDESLLRFLAPLGWEEGQFRPLRRHENP